MFLYVAYLKCLHMRFCDGDTQPEDLLFCDMCGMMSSIERVQWVNIPEAGNGLDAQG